MYRRLLILAACFLPVALWSSAQAADIEGIRVYAAPDNTRLVLDLNGPVEHRLELVEKQGDQPQRVLIDIDYTALGTGVTVPDLAATTISQLQFSTVDDFNLRVQIDLKKDINPKSFVLKPNEPYGHRLVIDLVDREQAKPIEKTIAPEGKHRDILVVIDAGHGGEDPGALGPNRLREKDITLSIAKKLAAIINAEPGYRAELTRNGDYFIELRRRSRIAQDKGADLFVSIHADAFKNPAASGASVFAWSQRGATSETAKFLADKENLSDLVGGADPNSVDDVLVQVLADLQLDGTVRTSLGIGKSILGEIGGMAKLHKHHVEQAGFMVLKSVSVPSLLVETGFISNPAEARNLGNKDYQEKMAASIFKGIKQYFDRIPPPGTVLAARKSGQTVITPANPVKETTSVAPVALPKPDNKPVVIKPEIKKPVVHIVKRGETLSRISARYNVTIAAIKKHNGLKSSTVYVGQKLKIPG